MWKVQFQINGEDLSLIGWWVDGYLKKKRVELEYKMAFLKLRIFPPWHNSALTEVIFKCH